MAITVAVRHKTTYKYDKSVQLSPQVIRLRPAPHTRAHIGAYSLKILPEGHFINWQQDPFGNYLARVVFPKPVSHFDVDVEVITEMKVINPFDFFVEEYAETYPFEYEETLKKELSPYLEIQEHGPALMRWIEKTRTLIPNRTVNFLVNVNQQLYQDVAYTIRLEEGVQTCEETLDKALGSCRDSAWVLVQVLRHLGLATRFVSGYLIQLKADQKVLDGPSGPEEDFTDLHAWCEVYVPGAGWIGLDATSGLFAGEGHIPLCCTPSPMSAAPISGYLLERTSVEFNYINKVYRIHEDPRVTKPYSDDTLRHIMQLGEQVEHELAAGDVRLTMGGEPTFVSRSDFESEQWNTAAEGADKKQKAFLLAQRLKDAFGQKGLLHYGQGKWYPGEPIPRWQFSVYWRKDGMPMIQHEHVYADITQESNYTFHDAEKLLKAICQRMGLPVTNIQPAYEDTYYYLWQESRLPVNIDPLHINLDEGIERATLSKVLQHGLNSPVGFVLPLEFNADLKSWLSCAWELRHSSLFLIPGISPMGLRLPLKSLPKMVAAQRKTPVERSPFEELPPLPASFLDAPEHQKKPLAQQLDEVPEEWLNPRNAATTASDEKDGYVVKLTKEEVAETEPTERMYTIQTALCVQEREGKLFVFMPPLPYAEHYLELLSVVEQTANTLGLTFILEGYTPPRDNRMEKLIVTPDPGVIEVNVHPASSWKEVVDNYHTLFDAALKCGLGTEKFMLDGRHVGSGGGHHITLGGITPSDSPLLRRPDVLKSFILFWQNHPGLSYLFSTAFIGPTSQAPRVDEGRPDRLYDLAIALDHIQPDNDTPFWLTDRLLRNLLTDMTGNTHRAEFCIDKLYSPDSLSGRLGILELRAFEMPAHEKMCLVQLLLIRTLVAWFWKTPYNQPLIRWGTELHDKFMIYTFVKEDLAEVCRQLNAAGYGFNMEWLEPFFEFRFPLLGKVNYGSIHAEVRLGIEPWQVLGEEMSNSGTARFVDSSIERVELLVKGLVPERYALLCNGRRVPLQATGRNEEYVAGIRYKAWAPPSALHPTLPVNVPLAFDIFDMWNKKSIGGFTYHVAHPGGRNYDTYPINAFEAESRRESRFIEFGHSTGTTQESKQWFQGTGHSSTRSIQVTTLSNLTDIPKAIEPDKEFPYTFDLRKN